MSLAISIQSLKIIRAKRTILDNLSLNIAAGERLAITGPSGVGKSSLLLAIVGLLKPAQGEILIAGKPVTGPLSAISLMQQRPALLPWANVAENVALGLQFLDKRRPERQNARQIVSDLLKQIGLADRADAMPAELSGGQQQRVALARSLAPNPSILLLDEPFSALDIQTRSALRLDVRKLTQARGVTTVLVTHDQADADALCDSSFSLEFQESAPQTKPTILSERKQNIGLPELSGAV